MGNDPINGIDPDGGYRGWAGAFLGWVGGGFKGSIDHVGAGGTKEWAVSNTVMNENFGVDGDDLAFTVQRNYGANSKYHDMGQVLSASGGWGKAWNFFAGPRTYGNFNVGNDGYATGVTPNSGLGVAGLVGGPSSYKLGRSLVKSGITRPANSAAHHIVAGTDKRASLARKILQGEKIGINSANNGVFLPKSSKYIKVKDAIPHSRIHTNLYYRELTKKLQSAGSGNVGKALEQFKSSILNGTVKY
jgi:hypothetical protein